MHVDTINCSVYNVIRSRSSIETMGTQKHDSIEQVLVVYLTEYENISSCLFLNNFLSNNLAQRPPSLRFKRSRKR